MYGLIKRVFDIFCSVILMIVLAITFPFVALGIKISSPGPIFYVSTRIGKNGMPFKFYKYRSMHVDNGTLKGIVAEQKRIYTFGKILRRTKIDELPQAFNVLRGDLSIVGPRPMLPTNAFKIYGGRYASVQSVKPGLTSYASLFDYTHGDACVENPDLYNGTILPIKREMELYYVENAGIWTDLTIILKTAWIILSVIFGRKNFPNPKEYYIAKKNLEELSKIHVN